MGKRKSSNASESYERTSSTPIYLLSYEIYGIRCFQGPAQTLDLTDQYGSWAQWTLILGNNGSGKSTLLQCLSRISLKVLKSTEEVVARLEIEFEDVGVHPEWPLLKLTAAESKKVETDEFTDDAPWERATVALGNSSATVSQLFRSTAGGPQVVTGRTWTVKDRNPRLVMFGYGAWRSLGDSTLRQPDPFGPQCPHLFSDKSELINAEEWLLRLDYGAEHQSKFSAENRRRFDQVRATLTGLLPEVHDIRIAEPIGPDRPPRLLFDTPYGEVELRQLGYGYQSLVAWVVDFAARMYENYPGSVDPLAEPAICLIDEIDLHLHPSWQRKLMSFLSERFPKTQFIATAHSPLVVQAAEEVGANVVVLRRESDHVVIDNDPISVKGWRVDQILSSELFEETPLRDAETEKWMARRVALLKKDKLTVKEKRELDELNAKVLTLPVGSTPAEQSIDEKLVRAVEKLEKSLKGKK